MTADREVLVESKDSTIVAPEVHQVVFENEHVRVIDARAANGAKVAMHSHPPMLFIGVGSGRQKVTLPDGETQVLDLNPGMVAWRDDPLEHAWELLAGEVHVILVEVKSANAREQTPINTPMKDENVA
jgi:quercetin dioxygenase-like cupin family protein